MERFACPSPDRQGRYHCIDDHVLCDGFTDCPNEEDEDRRSCMFYKTVHKGTSRRIGRRTIAMGARTLSNHALAHYFGASASQVQTTPKWFNFSPTSSSILSESNKTSLASATENNQLSIL
ncbi:hypothetical protein HUJ04_009888 [Dendroctonus ponderosae]|nr:hypothetical protein HUJ04_009888 [Dendroctonus ponderosae]